MSEDRHNEILKAMYGKVDINKHVKSLKHLTKEQKTKLASVVEAQKQLAC